MAFWREKTPLASVGVSVEAFIEASVGALIDSVQLPSCACLMREVWAVGVDVRAVDRAVD